MITFDFSDEYSVIKMNCSNLRGNHGFNQYGNEYDSMEIDYLVSTGRILDIDIRDLYKIEQEELKFPNEKDLKQYIITSVGRDGKQMGINTMGDFNIKYSKSDMAIYFGDINEAISISKDDRLVCYYDKNDNLICIRVKDLQESEYNKLNEIDEAIKLKQKNDDQEDSREIADISKIIEESRKKLKAIEGSENIVILHSFLTGSYSWGDATPTSDVDIKFIYVRRLQEYLSMSRKKDNINLEISNGEDLEGWDITKILLGIHSQNSTTYEFLNSDLIIDSNEEIITEIREYAAKVMNPNVLIKQYIGMVQYYLKKYRTERKLPTKKVILCLRQIGVVDYILKNGEFPKCNYETIFAQNLSDQSSDIIIFDEQIRRYLRQMILLKKYKIKEIPYDEKFVSIIEQALEKALSSIERYSDRKGKTTDEIDRLFYDVLQKEYGVNLNETNSSDNTINI